MPAGDTPRAVELQILIDGNRYDLAPEDKAKEAGGRSWSLDVIASQEADPTKAAGIQLASMHNGGGFTYQGLPFSYEHAQGGWDASQPGKWGTWPILARTADNASTSHRGWQMELGGYQYVGRGRYVRKYKIDPTFGSVWPLIDTHDLGATSILGGRPAMWRGKLYFPRVDATTGDEQLFHQLTTVTPGADAWSVGPVTREARCFTVWKGLLLLAQRNEVRTCAGNPLVAGDWAPDTTFGYLVGDAGLNILDLGIRQVELVIQKEEGPFTFNADLEGEMEIPDVERVIDPSNGIGMTYAQGNVINPHRAGLIQWNDEGYSFIGPNQEKQLEAAKTPGWGAVSGAATYGQYCFVVVNDAVRGQGALWSMQPGERNPSWHCHELLPGLLEDVQILSITEATPVPATYPTTWESDAANGGTINWLNADGAGAEDTAEATALEGTSKLLKGTMGMSIPADATISGILVELRRRQGVAVAP